MGDELQGQRDRNQTTRSRLFGVCNFLVHNLITLGKLQLVVTLLRGHCHAESLWEGCSCLIVCLIIPCWALLTSQKWCGCGWGGWNGLVVWFRNEETLKYHQCSSYIYIYIKKKVQKYLLTCLSWLRNKQIKQEMVPEEDCRAIKRRAGRPADERVQTSLQSC